MITQEQQKLIDLALKDASNKRTNAGYNGSHGDDGASIIESQVEAWKAGLEGRIPASMKKYEQQIDPEWETFQRLQKKFKNYY